MEESPPYQRVPLTDKIEDLSLVNKNWRNLSFEDIKEDSWYGVFILS
jgi:hypothetical protein